MRRAIGVALVLVLAFAGVASSADAPTRIVSMPGKLYAPEKLDVLVGTTVQWRNDDSVNHTVTSDGEDETLASGYIPPGGSFSFAFDKQGRYVFRCTIHRFMRGEVDVFGLVLSGPEAPVPAGARVVFAGLAPPGTASVTLLGAAGPAVVRPRADGSFAVRVAVGAPARFRAVAGSLSSPPVRVVVKPRVLVRRAGAVLTVRTTPPRPGAVALLQAYDRERFDWVTVRSGKLDRGSRARLTLPGRAERVRVLVRGTVGWGDAVSSTLRIGGAGGAPSTQSGSHSS